MPAALMAATLAVREVRRDPPLMSALIFIATLGRLSVSGRYAA